MQQSAFDMICFNAQCIRNKQQLFLYDRDSDTSNQHFRPLPHQAHTIERNSLLFKNLSMLKIKLHQSKDQYVNNIVQQFNNLKQRLNQLLDQRFFAHLQMIDQFYMFADEQSRYKSCQKNIKNHTKYTDFYTNVINHHFFNQQKSLSQYLDDRLENFRSKQVGLIKNCIKIMQNVQVQANNVVKKSQNSPVRKSQHRNESVVFKLKKPKQLIQRQSIQICRELLQSRGKIKFADLPSVLRQSLRGQSNVSGSKIIGRKLTAINISTFNCIEKQVFQDFKYSQKGITNAHKTLISRQMKCYADWMSPQEIIIYQKFLKFHFNIEPDVQIGTYEAYVIYTSLLIRLIQKLAFKGKELDYNTKPLDISKEIAFLHFHYSSLTQTIKILSTRYPNSRHVTPQSIKQKFVETILNIYQQILQKYSLQQNLLLYGYLLQGNYESQRNKWHWSRLLEIFIFFKIKGQINAADRQAVSNLVQKMVRNQINSHQRDKNHQISVKLQEKPQRDVQDHQQSKAFQRQRQKKRLQLIQDSKIIKLQHIEEHQRYMQMIEMQEQIDLNSSISQKQGM